MVIWIVAACAGTDSIPAKAIARRVRPGFISAAPWHLFQIGGNVFRVLLVTLENLQAGLEQGLEFGIARGRDELRLKRVVDGLVIGDFVRDVGFVESGAFELGKLFAFRLRLLSQSAACRIVLR